MNYHTYMYNYSVVMKTIDYIYFSHKVHGLKIAQAF